MIALSHIRVSIALILICLLGGCTVSPAVDAVSWAADGFSYFLTGKSMTDHAMSAAAGKDCAMSRMVKGENACLPKDENVAGDRMVFAFNDTEWGESVAADTGAGDPLSIHASVSDLAEPLGGSVSVEKRSAAVAAVAADNIPLSAFADSENGRAVTVFSARIKDKSSQLAVPPDRETRLWLPVEESAE